MHLGSLRIFTGGTRVARRRWRSLPEGVWGRLLVGSLFLALGFTAGCGGGSSSSGSSSNSGTISVSVSPSTASLAPGGTQQFTATVANDSSHQGVTWSLTQNGTACSPGCGTVSISTTASGSPTTYSAPGTAVSVTLTATSIANSTYYSAVLISVAGGISVVVSPNSASVPLGSTFSFNASVANDTTNKGVNWQLLQNGAACSPTCGTVSPTSTASGTPTTYTAPTAAPSSPTVTLKAVSVAASSATSYATITIQGSNAVTVSPTLANVPVSGTQIFTAIVTGGTGSQSVTWQLSQNGKSCSPACGSLSGSTAGTTSSTTTYTAPASPMTVTLTAASAADSKEIGSATIVVQPITVSVSPSFENMYPSQTVNYIATVNNDVAEKGVNWSLTEGGKSCSPGCGSFSSTSTLAGVATTYTAPSSVSSPATITVVATSVTNNKVSGTATIDLYPPIAVTVAPTTATSAINSRTSFTATVANDPTQAGVSWLLTQGGKACAPDCGSVSPTSTGSGIATTYFAPSKVPSSPTVTLTATSGVDITKSAAATITVSSSTTVAKVSGSYAFRFNGYDSGGSVAAAGTFTADGAGNVTGGIADFNRASGVTAARPITGTYTVGADNQGSLTLTGSSGATLGTYRFALNAAGDGAQFIEYDASGTRGSGAFRKQTVAAFSPATVLGDYAFSASGADAASGRLALAGAFHANGEGKITGGVLDTNNAGAISPELALSGSYAVSSSGRGTLAIATPGGVLRWAFYVVSPKEVFLVSTGNRLVQPLSSGKALAQSPGDPGGFSAASLDGASVISFAGAGSDGKASRIVAGLVTFDGSGGLNFRIDQNAAGKIATLTGSGTYSVSPDGRVKMVLPALGQPVVTYLVARNQGLLIGTGPGASIGALDPRAPGIFSDASLSGRYVLGTVAAPSSASSFEWGMVTGAGPGKLTGTAGSMGPSGVRLPLGSFSDTYSVSSDGRAALGSGASVVYLISPSKAIVADMTPGQTSATISILVK